MWHKPCRTFHLWCLCIKTRCLYTIEMTPITDSCTMVLPVLFWTVDIAPIYEVPKRSHDDVVKWKHFPRYWPSEKGIHWSLVNSPHQGQWREALMFSLICVWTNGWANHRNAGGLRRHRAHYDVVVTRPPYLLCSTMSFSTRWCFILIGTYTRTKSRC